MSSGDREPDFHLVGAAGAAAVDVAVEGGRAVVDRVPVVVAAFAVFLTSEQKNMNYVQQTTKIVTSSILNELF